MHFNFRQTNRKPNKAWVNKGSQFYNRSMKSRLADKKIEMYSAHLFVPERLSRTLKNKIYTSMTAISKNEQIDKLNDLLINTITHIVEK